MKSYRFIGTLTLLVSSTPVVQSFLAHHTRAITTTRRLMQKEATNTELSATGNPLYLQHVDTLHPHRDSVVMLEDNFENEKPAPDKNKSLHNFTNHLAPIVLAVYMIGHYLSTYQASSTALIDGSGDSSSIYMDPMFGGYVLIAAGLYMIKWSIDNSFLSPV